MDLELKEERTLKILVPNIVNGPIQQYFIDRFPGLEHGLAIGEIGKQGRRIFPYGIVGVKVYRGIKFPSRPFGPYGGIGRSVEEYMVDPVQQELLSFGLAL